MKIEARAATALSSLQASLTATGEKDREKASDSFQATSKSYGDTVDRVAAKEPEVAAKGTGQLILVAVEPSDAWVSGVDSILVHVQRVEGLRAGGKEQERIPLLSEAVDLDLLRLSGLGNILSNADLEGDPFTKIRLSISGTTVIVGGKATPAKIEAGAITLTEPFQIKAGQTSVVFLDFEGKRSVIRSGDGTFTLLPVVRVLAREPVRTEPVTQPEAKPRTPVTGNKPEDSVPAADQPSARAVPVNATTKGSIEVPGEVTRVDGGGLVIRGTNITIVSDATFDGPIAVGSQVRIQGQIDEKGGVTATNVQAHAVTPAPNTPNTVAREPTKPETTPSTTTPVPTRPTTTPPQTRETLR